jgi:biopolymer transport protein ExbB
MKRTRQRLLPIFACLLVMLSAAFWPVAPALHGQDVTVEAEAPAETGDAAAEAPAAEEGGKSLLDMFKAGGWAMYPLMLLSICGFGLIIYNFMAIKPGPFLVPGTAGQIDTCLEKMDVSQARSICEQNPAPVTNIMHAGLSRVDVDAFDLGPIKEAIEEASAEELASPYVLINYLSVIGTLAPMLGLLGTVSGMVKAFNAIAAEGVGNPQLLADNISEALITTATGMIIGIPAMFFFFYFKNKYGKITSRIGRVVGDLVFTLTTAVKHRPGAGA